MPATFVERELLAMQVGKKVVLMRMKKGPCQETEPFPEKWTRKSSPERNDSQFFVEMRSILRCLSQAAVLENLAAYTFGAIQPRAECGRTVL